MSHNKLDWETDGADHTYRGFEVRDHGVHADDVNNGNQEPDLDDEDES